MKKSPIKGMKDVLPNESFVRRDVQSKIIQTFVNNGFLEVSTPALEHLELLGSNQGGDNEKMMFKVVKRGEKLDLANAKSEADIVDMGLRFDLTIPLSRLYSNNMNDLPMPFKCFQIGNVWRGERPQKGRYRQFIQCDVDILGDATINAELTLIKTIGDALNSIGFKNNVIRINNRVLINELIAKFDLNEYAEKVMVILDKMDKLSYEKLLEEVSSNEVPVEKFELLLKEINELKDVNYSDLANYFKCSEINEFINLLNVLKNYGKYRFKYDPTLIRGLGYYTGTVFEVDDETLGLSVAGGGRYDNMIDRITSVSTPAVGFSIGFERIIQILMEKGENVCKSDKYAIIIDELVADEYLKVMREVDRLQGSGKVVSVVTKKKNVSKQIDDLISFGFNQICIYKDVFTYKIYGK